MTGERFLSVTLGPHHIAFNARANLPTALVLEFEDNQWVLYYLDSGGEIERATFPGSLEAGLSQARAEFGIRPDEWIEEFAN